MACLRRAAPEGRIGAVQCDEEGCQFRPLKIGESIRAFENTPTTNCVLQLRLRAGDVEDAESEPQRYVDRISQLSGPWLDRGDPRVKYLEFPEVDDGRNLNGPEDSPERDQNHRETLEANIGLKFEDWQWERIKVYFREFPRSQRSLSMSQHPSNGRRGDGAPAERPTNVRGPSVGPAIVDEIREFTDNIVRTSYFASDPWSRHHPVGRESQGEWEAREDPREFIHDYYNKPGERSRETIEEEFIRLRDKRGPYTQHERQRLAQLEGLMDAWSSKKQPFTWPDPDEIRKAFEGEPE